MRIVFKKMRESYDVANRLDLDKKVLKNFQRIYPKIKKFLLETKPQKR